MQMSTLRIIPYAALRDLQKLGSGAFGDVYEVHWELRTGRGWGRQVARLIMLF